ncbi:MAG: hypothetical protein LRZ84_26910 [Desertifilum sp.]|nr:hypothetical protein [Desertifilum sp.]
MQHKIDEADVQGVSDSVKHKVEETDVKGVSDSVKHKIDDANVPGMNKSAKDSSNANRPPSSQPFPNKVSTPATNNANRAAAKPLPVPPPPPSAIDPLAGGQVDTKKLEEEARNRRLR